MSSFDSGGISLDAALPTVGVGKTQIAANNLESWPSKAVYAWSVMRQQNVHP